MLTASTDSWKESLNSKQNLSTVTTIKLKFGMYYTIQLALSVSHVGVSEKTNLGSSPTDLDSNPFGS